MSTGQYDSVDGTIHADLAEPALLTALTLVRNRGDTHRTCFYQDLPHLVGAGNLKWYLNKIQNVKVKLTCMCMLMREAEK